MMRRGESFHGIVGGGRFRLELVWTCPCLSAPTGHPAFAKLTRSKERKRSENEREREREGEGAIKKRANPVGKKDKAREKREKKREEEESWEQTGRTRRTIIIYRS